MAIAWDMRKVAYQSWTALPLSQSSSRIKCKALGQAIIVAITDRVFERYIQVLLLSFISLPNAASECQPSMTPLLQIKERPSRKVFSSYAVRPAITGLSYSSQPSIGVVDTSPLEL